MTAIREFRIHRFGGPEVLQSDEVEPSLPDASQVLVTVKAVSVNPVDFKIRSGKYPAVKEDRLPYTLGRDVSGVVEKCGAQATAFKVGDEVFGMVGNQRRRLRREGCPRPEGDRAQACAAGPRPRCRHPARGTDRVAGPVPARPVEGWPVRPDPRRLRRCRPFRCAVRQGERRARADDGLD